MIRLVYVGLNPSKAGWPRGDLTVSKLIGFSHRIAGAQRLFEAAGDRGPVPVTIESGGALFSDDGRYRYRLWRVLDTPVRRVRFDVVNMYGLVATQQADLWEHVSPVGHDGLGLENDRHVREAVAEADMVIAAWGGLPRRESVWRREKEILELLSMRHDVKCLGKTADGEPRHPSRIAYSTALELFHARRAA